MPAGAVLSIIGLIIFALCGDKDALAIVNFFLEVGSIAIQVILFLVVVLILVIVNWLFKDDKKD